jgi:ribonucleoside-triphosphate reductase
MKEKEDMLNNIVVIKRNGSKVDFNGTKIAMAIKKGFDSVTIEDENGDKSSKYSEKDIQKVYQGVIKTIEKNFWDNKTIKIEDIQDIIEVTLKKDKYELTYNA